MPVPGPTGWLSSIFGAVQFFKNAEQMLEEGYTKVTHKIFYAKKQFTNFLPH